MNPTTMITDNAAPDTKKLLAEHAGLLAQTITFVTAHRDEILRAQTTEPDNAFAALIAAVAQIKRSESELALTCPDKQVAGHLAIEHEAAQLYRAWRTLFAEPAWQRGGDLTCAQLAVLFGLSPQAVARWIDEPRTNEHGQMVMSSSNLTITYEQDQQSMHLDSPFDPKQATEILRAMRC